MVPYYDDGQVTIYHGDCRDVLPSLTGVADLAMTDPPYLVAYEGRWNSDWSPIANDDDDAWVETSFSGIYSALKDDGLCISFYGWPHIETFMSAWRRVGFRPVSHMVWVKNVWGLGYYTRGQHEQGFVLAKPGSRKPSVAISDVVNWTRVQDPVHPTQKPLDGLRTVIGAFCPANGVVLDPFMGSGSTLRAAKDLGRRGIGVEIEERYCEAAVKSLAQSVLPLGVA